MVKLDLDGIRERYDAHLRGRSARPGTVSHDAGQMLAALERLDATLKIIEGTGQAHIAHGIRVALDGDVEA